MSEPLLWPLDEAARQLGGVHPRTVRRLIQAGHLSGVRVGARLLVSVASARAYVTLAGAHSTNPAPRRTDKEGQAPWEDVTPSAKTGSIAAQTHRSGTYPSRQDAANKLAALLAFPSPKTRKG